MTLAHWCTFGANYLPLRTVWGKYSMFEEANCIPVPTQAGTGMQLASSFFLSLPLPEAHFPAAAIS